MKPWPPVQRPCPAHPDRIISLGPDPMQQGKHTCTWCQEEQATAVTQTRADVAYPWSPLSSHELRRQTPTHELRVLRIGAASWWALWRKQSDPADFVVEGVCGTRQGAKNIATRAAGRDR